VTDTAGTSMGGTDPTANHPRVSPAAGTRDFDAIIVGSGPGGSAAAYALTRAGHSVLIVERGRNHLIDLDDPSRLLARFSNDEIKFGPRHFLGPDPLVEPRTFRTAESERNHEFVGEVNNLPATVGGGAVHADGKVPRFLEEDFRLLSERGPVDGAEVADWPLSYSDLEPFYEEAERLIGVAGEAGANPFAAPRSGPYPMPPGAPMYTAVRTAEAAERLGLHPYAAPTAANSVPYDGRPACNNCGFCAFSGCPIHAKGDPVALLQKALLTGRAAILPEHFARRVIVTNGIATGVELIDRDGRTTSRPARFVVVAGGAVDTARLLLLSGVEHPMLGACAMFHFQTYVAGGFPERLHAHRGRAVTHVHDDHLVADDASRRAASDAGLPWIRGGMVEHAGASLPIAEAKLYPWGPAHRSSMVASPLRDHLGALVMQGEDLPQLRNRVDLDPVTRDARGLPVARVTYSPHRHEYVASAHYAATLEKVIRSAGATWSATATSPMPDTPYGGDISPVPSSRHAMGTARMGTSRDRSVCDPWGRLFDVPNVLVADSALFPTAAGYGPTLTIVALALRNATELARTM
jgi:choline dehydrogenase-like flavoprotein